MQCPSNPGRSTIVRAKAPDTARFGRIDRSIGEPPCALRCLRTDARNAAVGSCPPAGTDLRALPHRSLRRSPGPPPSPRAATHPVGTGPVGGGAPSYPKRPRTDPMEEPALPTIGPAGTGADTVGGGAPGSWGWSYKTGTE